MAAWLGLLGLTLSPQLRARLVTLTDAKRPTMCGVAPPGARDAPLIDAESAPFEAQLAALRAWREEIGHADVPLGSPLGRWVYTQRRLRQEGRMPADRAAALEAEGLRWTLDPDDVPWDEMMDRFISFRTEHGHGRVPKKFVQDPLLGAWVALTRRRKRLLPADRRERLTAAGFEWSPPPDRCGSQFMIGFRAWVEAAESGAPRDARWEEAQRAARRKGKLSQVRVEYLDGAGFDWRGADLAGSADEVLHTL